VINSPGIRLMHRKSFASLSFRGLPTPAVRPQKRVKGKQKTLFLFPWGKKKSVLLSLAELNSFFSFPLHFSCSSYLGFVLVFSPYFFSSSNLSLRKIQNSTQMAILLFKHIQLLDRPSHNFWFTYSSLWRSLYSPLHLIGIFNTSRWRTSRGLLLS